jgi:hypothetical protein
MRFRAIVMSMKYGPDQLKRNTQLVVSVIKKSDNKVEKVVVVERPALELLLERLQREYPLVINTILISSTSIVGEFHGFKDSEEREDKESDSYFGTVN